MGQNSASDLITVDDKTGLHRIYARALSKPEADLLSSDQMVAVIDNLRGLYDVIILDTPPSLAVSDSRLLSKLSDKLLYVVQWQKTPREVIKTAISHLKRDGVDVTGFVISQVDMKRHAQYRYGDMGSYYQTYHAYFSE